MRDFSSRETTIQFPYRETPTFAAQKGHDNGQAGVRKSDRMRFLPVLAITLTLTFAGCNACFNVECDAPDTDLINGLHFEFSKQSFNYSEIDQAYVLRFTPGNLQAPVDTLRLNALITDADRTFHIGTRMFGNAVDFAGFDYGIYNNSGEYAYLISYITTSGHYPTDCCCCYRNREKTFVLNGTAYDRSGSIEPFVLIK